MKYIFILTADEINNIAEQILNRKLTKEEMSDLSDIINDDVYPFCDKIIRREISLLKE